MKKGGTQAPVKRKTAGHKVGDKVRCISAASSWFKVGQVYDVVAHPVSQLASVVGTDGLHDELCMVASRFESHGGR